MFLAGMNFGPAASGNVVVPDRADVRSGVQYGIDSALTGSLVLPAPELVLLGVGYGSNSTEKTGSYRVVAEEEFFLESLVIGDDYLVANNRQLVFTIALQYTPTASKLKFWHDSKGSVSIDHTTIDDNGDGTFSITHEIASADTAGVLEEGMFRWALTLENGDGKKSTVSYGDCDFGMVKWVKSGTS